jgi:hypothetical protein
MKLIGREMDSTYKDKFPHTEHSFLGANMVGGPAAVLR